MKRKILLFPLASLLAISLVAVGCGAPAPEAPEVKAPEPVLIRFVCGLPFAHHTTKVMELFEQEVEANSNGLIEVELYAGAELYGHKDMVRVIPSGAVEMAITSGGTFAGLNPIGKAMGQPFLTDPDHEKFDKGRATFISVLDTELQKKANVKILDALSWFGEQGFASRDKLIKQPSDLVGLKIRGPGSDQLDAITQWGGIGVSLSAAEVTDAIGKGSIDGALAGFTTWGTRGYYEVADYFSGSTASVPWLFIVNLDTWNGLTPALQQVITEAAQTAEELGSILSFEGDETYLQMGRDTGNTIHLFTPEELVIWKEASQPLYDKWIADCKEAGIEAEAISIFTAFGLAGY